MRKSTLASRAACSLWESQSQCYVGRQAHFRSTILAPRPGQLQCWQYIQIRHFLGISNWTGKSRSSDGSSVDREAGIKQMNELVVASRNQLRPPPPYVLARAFKSFVEGRLAHPDFLTLEQVHLLYATIEHLVSSYWDGTGAVKLALQSSTLKNALAFLAASHWEDDARDSIDKLARFVYDALCRRVAEEDGVNDAGTPDTPAIKSYIAILSASKSTDDALKLLEEHWDSCPEAYGVQPWADILRGFISDANPKMVNATLEKMEARGLATSALAREQISSFLTKEDQPGLTKKIFDRALAQEREPSVALTKAAIRLAVQKNMIPWARQLLASLPRQGRTPECLSVILLVDAAAGDEAKHIRDKLKDLTTTDPELRASVTIETINELMHLSLASSRYPDVEKYACLSEAYNLQKNANTYMIWMCSRLRSGDIQGAINISEKLENETSNENVDPFLLNRLIRSLCSAHNQNFDYDVILCLVDRLLDSSKGAIEAPTVAALCTSMLSQHDTTGVADLLEHVGGSFGSKDQETVKQPLISYIHDSSEPSERAWDMYELLVKMFPSTSVHVRTLIMKTFFKRGRPDYASLVFGHMRAEDLNGNRPTKETYIECLKGIAEYSDDESLKMIHNMLKMDMQIRLGTRLMNALMLAYASCGHPDAAMEYFREILHSEEGPSDQSLLIFFRTCETHYDGRKEAEDMVKELDDLGIKIDKRIYTGFVAALGCQGDLQGALSAIRSMSSRTGEAPDSITIATLYNSLPIPLLKAQAEEWAKTTHPALWAEVEALGHVDEPEGIRHYRIDRTIDI